MSLPPLNKRHTGIVREACRYALECDSYIGALEQLGENLLEITENLRELNGPERKAVLETFLSLTDEEIEAMGQKLLIGEQA